MLSNFRRGPLPAFLASTVSLPFRVLAHGLRIVGFAGVLATVAPPGALAQVASRASDQQVKALLAEAKDGVSKVIDGMRPEMRTAVLKGPSGEVHMKDFLEDYKEAAQKAKDRFSSDHPATTEVVDFLKKSKAVDARVKPEMKAGDEWAALRTRLLRLSKAYGLDFEQDPALWSPARLSDRDLKAAVKQLQSDTKAYEKALKPAAKANVSLDPAQRKQIETSAAALSQAAGALKSSFTGSNVPTQALQRVLDAGRGMSGPTSGLSLPTPVETAWQAVRGGMGKIAGAFGLPGL